MAQLKLLRASLWRQRSLFILWTFSLSLTVTGLVIIDVYRESLAYLLENQGRKILSADAMISARRKLTDTEKKDFTQALPQGSEQSELTEMLAMITAGKKSRLALIRFVDDKYPLVGDLHVDTPQTNEKIGAPVRGQNLGQLETWAAADLENLLGVKLGDKIKVGALTLTVAGVVRKDSSQTLRFNNLAPRIYVHRRSLPNTKLIQFGSTFTDQQLALISSPVKNLKKQLEDVFADPGIQITVPTDLEQGSLSVLSRLLDYLGLIGLVTLTLGWIGVYYLGRRWLTLELPVAGSLKSLGFSSGQIFRHLSAKLLIILFVSVINGGLLAWLMARSAYPFVAASLPEDFVLIWSWKSTFLLLAIGPLAGLLLMLEPIRRASVERPLRLMYESHLSQARLSSQLLLATLVGALFLLLTYLQARSFRITGIFVLCLGGAWLLTAALGGLWLFQSGKFRTPKDTWAWHLASSIWLRRRGTSLLLIVVSALAGLLSQLVPHMRNTIVGELSMPEALERPGLFMIDIQDEQLPAMQEFLNENQIQVSTASPFIRARILKVNEEAFERSEPSAWKTREAAANARFRNRGVNLSYRETLSPSENILRGKDWESMSAADPPEISVEKSYAERMNLKLGDNLIFDVQGVEVAAKIASLREIKWNSFEPNFFIQFKPGVLNEAPKTWIMTVKRHGELSPVEIQNRVTERFSNVTSINVQEAIDNTSALINKLSSGLRVASFLALALGVMVFLIILLFQIQSSQPDWMQLRHHGLTLKEIQKVQFYAYGILALVGTLLGSILSWLVNYGLARWALNTGPRPDWIGAINVILVTWILITIGLYWIGQRSSFLRK